MNTRGVERFTPSRLILARERRGLTQRELSSRSRISDRMVKAYESGDYQPAPETLTELARVLDFPVAFFEGPPVEMLEADGASFRAMTKASSALRRRTLAAGTLALELHRFLSDRFELPKADLPDMRAHSLETKQAVPGSRRHPGPERAAEMLRHMWGLGQRPIANVTHLLETHGVRVFSLSEDCMEIDAFSIWRDGVPFVFLNNRKTAERSIFDAAHELGHLVLHRHGAPQGQEAEAQADSFAASFLLPESALRACAPRLATIGSIAGMKATWRASVAAIGFRLHELGLMSEWHYRHFNIELSRRGRSNEPSPLPRETSAVLRKAINALAEEGIGLREIAKELCLPASELRALTFGLGVLEGGGRGSPTPSRGTLRLLES
jgi:Zn-dependent peptidase ImmA (M78 family)/transcriptional regulator with XRE-family HTH domain